MSLRRAILAGPILALAFGWPAAAGAEPSPYRLQLDDGQAYRLASAAAGRSPDQPGAATLAGRPYASEIAQAARAADLDPALVHAVIEVESAYRADARSDQGAVGLMQVLPATARRFGVADAADPKANLRAGTRYLRALLDQFDQRTDLALAGYNAGEGAVLRHAGAIPPYAETRRYVPAVLGKYTRWRSQPRPPVISYLAGTRLELPTRQP